MDYQYRNSLYSKYEQAFNELYILNSLINTTKILCEDREFKGKYYNIDLEKAKMLSEERNEYINMMSVLSDKIKHVINLYLALEKEFTLEQNANNCSR